MLGPEFIALRFYLVYILFVMSSDYHKRWRKNQNVIKELLNNSTNSEYSEALSPEDVCNLSNHDFNETVEIGDEISSNSSCYS